ncbi:MAG: hypothetical protein V4594_14945 [Bacteroidota bacterium]
MIDYALLYLDDEKDKLILPIKEKFEEDSILNITLDKPQTFEDEIDKLIPLLSDFKGLILDLQLNGPQESGLQVRYQAPTLAQQLRILATENTANDLPIFLCSTEEKIKASFTRDFSSHDLFDWTFLKNEINKKTIGKIVAVIDAYDKIKLEPKNFSEIIQYPYEDLDQRILSRFVNEDNPPVHEIARMIFKEIIQENGLLISEGVLASRLGVDIEASSDWHAILSAFSECSYKGIYSSGWIRWWADNVADYFEEISGQSLGFLNAGERVELLKQNLKLNNLIAAQALPLCQSTNFWTICQATGKPIDTFEAYKIDNKKEPRPWQDYSYVSLYALMERIAESQNIKLHTTELDRFEQDSAAL